MITPAQVYLLTRLDAFKDMITGAPMNILIASGLVSTLIMIILSCIYMFAGNGSYDIFEGKSDEEFAAIRETLRKWRNRTIGFMLACMALVPALSAVNALVPTSKEMAAIVVVPKIANSQPLNDIAASVVDLANAWLKELKPATPEK
jgi:hypothetical protein